MSGRETTGSASEEEIEAEVASVLQMIVHIVATRLWVDENEQVIWRLEESQRHSWVQLDRARRKSHSTVRSLRAASAHEHPGSDGHECSPWHAALQPPNMRPSSPAVPDVPAPRCHVSSAGRSHAGSTAKCAAGAGAAASRLGGRKAQAVVPSWMAAASSAGGCTEALLPTTPARSQFNFESEDPLKMHSAVKEVQQLQRRLNMLSSLQQETVRLEKQQRAEASVAVANRFYCAGLHGTAESSRGRVESG